jgi:hypothetical protein
VASPGVSDPGAAPRPRRGQAMVNKIGMFILVTFALIALIKEPQTVANFIEAIGLALGRAADALGELLTSVG